MDGALEIDVDERGIQHVADASRPGVPDHTVVDLNAVCEDAAHLEHTSVRALGGAGLKSPEAIVASK